MLLGKYQTNKNGKIVERFIKNKKVRRLKWLQVMMVSIIAACSDMNFLNFISYVNKVSRLLLSENMTPWQEKM